MANLKYQIITSNIELANKTVDYFLSEVTNQNLFEEIKRIGVEQTKKMNRPSGENFISMGYFSVSDFLMYLTETRQVGGGIRTKIIEVLIRALEEEGVVNTFPESIGHSHERRYKASGDYARFLHDRDLILNVACGWVYIINRYRNSVVKIEHQNNVGDYSIGTGFYFAAGNEKFVKPLIITNKHVVEKASSIKVFSKDNIEIKYSDIKIDAKRDLGFIELENQLETPTFHFNPAREILSEVLTIGYPSIPMTKQAYQVYHKGELNSFVEDYQDHELFLFSAKTSSGNSGSPIIDKYGMVIGIVTEELFEKEQFYQKGKLPYYAGIPTDEIIKSVNEIIFTRSAIVN